MSVIPTSMQRTRWAAIGAAIAISLGAGGIGYVGATVSSGERRVFVPIVPCRILDTRAEFQVGPRATPLGANETYAVASLGSVGNCELPTDALGLALNVTATDATAPTFLTIWAAGAAQPTASHLNPLPGEGPTPNAVTTDLGTGGAFTIYNLQGSVNVLADVVGYYADHTHDDRYPLIGGVYTKAEVDTLLADKPFLPLQPHLLDFVPVPANSWTFNDGWRHSAGSVQCLLLPIVDPPADSRINRINLVYSATAPAELSVSVQSLRRTAGIGAPNIIVSMVNDAVPLAAGITTRSIEIPHDIAEVPVDADAGSIPGPGYDTVAQFCTSDALRIVSASLDYRGIGLGL